MQVMMPMTENDRRVLTLVAEKGPLPKRSIAGRAGIGWATVVKIVGRLEQNGYLRQAGHQAQPSVQGPDSLLYDLAEAFPLAAGIDIEYRRTTAALVDLRGRIHARYQGPTPSFRSPGEIAGYCLSVREELFSRRPGAREATVGTGVGLPFHLVESDGRLFDEVRDLLAGRTEGHVEVDDVARAYALKVQHAFPEALTFAVVTIRTGVGLGMFLNGRMFGRGEPYTGLLGHAVVEPESGLVCPYCGNAGCLGRVVNQELVTEERLERAARGDAEMQADLRRRAHALARALAQVITVMHPGRLYVAGRFGGMAGYFDRLLREALSGYVPKFVPYSLETQLLADDWFPEGAAFLVLSHYCNYEFGR